MCACKFYLLAHITQERTYQPARLNQFDVIQIPTLTIWSDTEQMTVSSNDTNTSSKHGAHDVNPQYNVHTHATRMRNLITSQQRRRMDFISLTLVAHVHSALVAFVTYDVTRDTFMQGSAVNIINKQAHERVRQQTRDTH